MLKEGIINLLKPAGMTSHDGVQLLRRLTGIKRIGHTGTLDPMAAGVLPICIGSAARITEYLDLDYKTYRCEMQLGLETDTQDIWGAVTARNPDALNGIDKERITDVLNSFCGYILQTPPEYSAVRVEGRRLYDYARKGETVEVKPREIHIKEIRLIATDFVNHRVTFDVKCSKGTYIRTICRDAGRLLGCGGVMSCLIRTSSGRFTLAETVTIEELLALRQGEDIRDPLTGKYIEYARADEKLLENFIIDPDYPLIHFGKAVVNSERGNWFVNGGHLRMSEVDILKEPAFKNDDSRKAIREEYKNAYNIYVDSSQRSDAHSITFLGVAFYNKTYKKLVADKIFTR